MFTNKVVCSVVIFASIVTITFCVQSAKTQEGVDITFETCITFYSMFMKCIATPMPSMKFALDDLKNFVNYPSRTTVGFAPRFTNNRKFFANLISTADFKNMVANDEEHLKQNMIKKMRFCDTVVMDQDMLLDLYDREVDQTKM